MELEFSEIKEPQQGFHIRRKKKSLPVGRHPSLRHEDESTPTKESTGRLILLCDVNLLAQVITDQEN